MRRIDEDIASGKFQNLYLLYGTEEYLKEQYKKKLIDALVNPGDSMNFSSFYGAAAKDKGVVEIAETMPFLAKEVGPDGDQYRVILIERSGFGSIQGSKEKDNSRKKPEDLILDYLSEISETTIIIFVEEERIDDKKIDGKVNKKYRLFKAADKVGRAIELNMPNEAVLKKWVGARIKASGKQIAMDAWERFLVMTGSSMNNMNSELEKLISYVGDRPQITLEDVNAVCIEGIDVKIYELADALAEKNARKTFDIYHEWMAARVEPRTVLNEIIKLYSRLKLIKQMDASGRSLHDIAATIGTQDYYVKINLPRAKRFSAKELDEMLKDAADYSKKINTGLLNEKMAVELLMMKYAGQ